MKLSIIIPAYNAEQYLNRCLDSIFQQNLNTEDFEVIAINDGSIDNTKQILEEFQKKYTNIILENQENFGEAISRNKALSLSKGEYITFLDSDDYYDALTLSKSLLMVESQNLDILYLKINQISEDYNFIQSLPDLSDNEILPGLKHERRPFPATIYKKSVIGDIQFPLNIIVGPDSVFNALVQSNAKRVSYSSELVYNYLVRPNSLSKKAVTEEGYQGFINAITALDEFKIQNFSEDNYDAQLYFDKVISVFVTRIVEFHILPNLYKPKYLELKNLLTKKGYWHLAKTIAGKYPYFDTSFSKFALHQKKLIFKTKIYNAIQSLSFKRNREK